VLGNGDVRISYVAAGEPARSPQRVGDECVYVESGSRPSRRCSVRCRPPGDYVILPAPPPLGAQGDERCAQT
jgi:homogentisate 1,2-dioxygenase